MKKYRVILKDLLVGQFVVEANDEEEAKQKVLDDYELYADELLDRQVECDGEASLVDELESDRIIK